MKRFAYGRDILHRFEGNPIVTLEDIPFRASTVFNGAPVKMGEDYYMLLRVEGQQGYSVFALARSDDGLRFTVDDCPVMVPIKEGPFAKFEARGIEDPRITKIDNTLFYVHRLFKIRCVY